jgi:hypothetical protein
MLAFSGKMDFVVFVCGGVTQHSSLPAAPSYLGGVDLADIAYSKVYSIWVLRPVRISRDNLP